MFRFDNFCEQWAQSYLPLSHNPSADGRGVRFCRHDTIDENGPISQALTTLNSNGDSFMTVITAFDGELVRLSENAPKPNFWAWRRHVLFWVREAQGSSKVLPLTELGAADAKARGVEMATDFIAFIDLMKDEKRGNMPELQGIDLDTVEIITLPRKFNGWWVTCINFDQLEPRQKCTVGSKYDESTINNLFPLFNKAITLQNKSR